MSSKLVAELVAPFFTYLGCPPVKTHTKNIYHKLNARNRTQALARAGELGLL